jgi:acetoin utilization protein AcuB
MRVAEVMTRDVRTVRPTMRAADARELMRRERIHHLVVTAGAEVVGVVSDRDGTGPGGALMAGDSSVRDLMTPRVVTIDPAAPVRKAANLMRGRTIGCLPVLKGKRLVGIVTVSDLLELVGGGVDRPAQSVRHALHHRVAHRKLARASGVW